MLEKEIHDQAATDKGCVVVAQAPLLNKGLGGRQRGWDREASVGMTHKTAQGRGELSTA